MSSSATRPRMRSPIGSMISPPSTSAPRVMPSMAPQSYSVMMASCATSTRRRVRYPELAVLSAVSARPLRAPCVEMKYWRTLRPSRKFAVIGRLDDLARRLGHEAAHAGQLPDLLRGAAGARVGHDVDRVERRLLALLALALPVDAGGRLGADLAHHLLGDLLGDLRPDVDDLVVALAVGDETLGVLVLDVVDLLVARSSSSCFFAGITMSSMAMEMPAFVALPYPMRPDAVGEEDGLLLAAEPVGEVDEALRAASCP